MKQKFIPLLHLIPASILLVFLVSRLAPPIRWWFVSQPPVPVQAVNLQIRFPVNGHERETHFEVDQSAYIIQQFYQVELPKDGWLYQCTVQAQNRCGHLTHLTDAEIIDVYYRESETDSDRQRLEVLIMNDDTTAAVGKRPVLIYERR